MKIKSLGRWLSIDPGETANLNFQEKTEKVLKSFLPFKQMTKLFEN